jgi:pyruvate kinase
VAPADFLTGPLLLRDHARRLLGAPPRERSVRIMVTMPSEAAENYSLIESLLRAGMDVMRINCAHDDAVAWRRMADNLRRAELVVGRKCQIQADLAGPKLRTGSITPAGHFRRIKPKRDAMGRVAARARVWLTPADAPEPPLHGALPLPVRTPLHDDLLPGDRLELEDLRGRLRSLEVVSRQGRSWLAEADRTAYIEQGCGFRILREAAVLGEGCVGDLPGVSVPIGLQPGDRIVLTRDDSPGRDAERDQAGAVLSPARIHCTLPAAFDRVQGKHRVWFDDGKIGGAVLGNDGDQIEIEISHAPPSGARLRAEKGINFPDTDLGVGALTDKDLADLRAVVGFVDMVALSFLRRPEDVERLEDELHALGAGHLGIVLKIENSAAFRNLPRILLVSLRSPPVGVMVARGDLAVEMGFERLSEVQEEILWLCEAAHVPVIWATQVLERLAKAGAPSRAQRG